MYHKIHVGHVPEHKLRKAVKTGKLHLTHEELAGSGYHMYVHPMTHKHLTKHKGKKGVHMMLSHNEIGHNVLAGGTIWSSIKDFWNKNGTKILDSAAAVGHVLAPEFSPIIDAARGVAQTITGKGLRSKADVHAARLHNLAKARQAKAAKKHGGSFRLS